MSSKFLKEITAYSAADIIGRAIGIIVSPIVTRLLTPEQYGAPTMMSAVWATIAVFQYGGMDWAYPFFRSQNNQQTQRIVVTATFVSTTSTLALWFLFTVTVFCIPWFLRYLGVSYAELALFTVAIVPSTLVAWYLFLLRFMHETMAFTRITLVGRVAPALIGLPFMMLASQNNRLAVSLGSGLLVMLLSLFWALWELKHAKLWPYLKGLFSSELARKMLLYGIALLPGGTIYGFSFVVDRLLVGWFRGPADVAVLSLALGGGSIASIVRSWFALAWDPHMVEWIATKKPSIYLPKLQSALFILSAVFFGLTCLARVWCDPVIHILYPPSYYPASELVPIIVFATACSALSLVGVATALAANSPRYHLPIYSIALLLNFVVSLITIPRIGVMGAVLGTAASEIWIMLAWMVLGKYYLQNLRLDWRVALMIAALSGFFILAYKPGMFFQNHLMLERIMVSISLCASSLYVMWRSHTQNLVRTMWERH